MKLGWIVVVAACSRGTDSIDGPAVFADYCTNCHGPKGQPPAAMVARINVRDLTSAELRAKVTPELVENQIRKGSQNGMMPSFANLLSDAQIKAVAAWVASPGFVAPR